MDSICSRFSHEALLVVRLNCYYVLGLPVLGPPDYGKSALADLQTYLEIFEIKWLVFWFVLSPVFNEPSEGLQPAD